MGDALDQLVFPAKDVLRSAIFDNELGLISGQSWIDWHNHNSHGLASPVNQSPLEGILTVYTNEVTALNPHCMDCGGILLNDFPELFEGNGFKIPFVRDEVTGF
jgi:hypothetical protein